ncbi:hypothetical protein EC973_000833 [Apophysomyces ossiformis]|uniref:SH3 domain-containing protein n=1 Tax=Apophysomyces ossiformis TaxID=679940 RepID=A0A8H7BL61_9FUNG|nr:hypothetical protein EC973_000833 [Apophysomyces ossiformis]
MTTRDTDFIALEKKFTDFSKVVDRLVKDAQTFRDSISVLLGHQASMAAFLAIIYDTNLGIENQGIQKRVQQTPAAAVQAVNDAEAAMAYCREEILPELDAVDRYVVRPALELQEIEALLDTATQDYEYLNNMLKQQLPEFFRLKSLFIRPVFEHFYNLQSKIYGMMYARCYELLNANLQHFHTNQMPVVDGFQWRKSQRDFRAEMENLDLLKSGGKAWLAASGGANNSKLSLQERAALRAASSPPPAYTSPGHSPVSNPTPTSPPAPLAREEPKYVLALYDYDAQATDDLSFRKDDKIELIKRTDDQNDWWTGRLRGVTGLFPGNYVKLL